MLQRLNEAINRYVDLIAKFLSEKPGLLPVFGLACIVINFVLQIYPGPGTWIVDTNLFLHAGLVTAIVGILLIRPLS